MASSVPYVQSDDLAKYAGRAKLTKDANGNNVSDFIYMFGEFQPSLQEFGAKESPESLTSGVTTYFDADIMKTFCTKLSQQWMQSGRYLGIPLEHFTDSVGEIRSLYVTKKNRMGLLALITNRDAARQIWSYIEESKKMSTSNRSKKKLIGLSSTFYIGFKRDPETNVPIEVTARWLADVSIVQYPAHKRYNSYVKYATRDPDAFAVNFNDYMKRKISFIPMFDQLKISLEARRVLEYRKAKIASKSAVVVSSSSSSGRSSKTWATESDAPEWEIQRPLLYAASSDTVSEEEAKIDQEGINITEMFISVASSLPKSYLMPDSSGSGQAKPKFHRPLRFFGVDSPPDPVETTQKIESSSTSTTTAEDVAVCNSEGASEQTEVSAPSPADLPGEQETNSLVSEPDPDSKLAPENNNRELSATGSENLASGNTQHTSPTEPFLTDTPVPAPETMADASGDVSATSVDVGQDGGAVSMTGDVGAGEPATTQQVVETPDAAADNMDVDAVVETTDAGADISGDQSSTSNTNSTTATTTQDDSIPSDPAELMRLYREEREARQRAETERDGVKTRLVDIETKVRQELIDEYGEYAQNDPYLKSQESILHSMMQGSEAEASKAKDLMIQAIKVAANSKNSAPKSAPSQPVLEKQIQAQIKKDQVVKSSTENKKAGSVALTPVQSSARPAAAAAPVSGKTKSVTSASATPAPKSKSAAAAANTSVEMAASSHRSKVAEPPAAKKAKVASSAVAPRSVEITTPNLKLSRNRASNDAMAVDNESVEVVASGRSDNDYPPMFQQVEGSIYDRMGLRLPQHAMPLADDFVRVASSKEGANFVPLINGSIVPAFVTSYDNHKQICEEYFAYTESSNKKWKTAQDLEMENEQLTAEAFNRGLIPSKDPYDGLRDRKFSNSAAITTSSAIDAPDVKTFFSGTPSPFSKNFSDLGSKAVVVQSGHDLNIPKDPVAAFLVDNDRMLKMVHSAVTHCERMGFPLISRT